MINVQRVINQGTHCRVCSRDKALVEVTWTNDEERRKLAKKAHSGDLEGEALTKAIDEYMNEGGSLELCEEHGGAVLVGLALLLGYSVKKRKGG